MSWSRAHPPRLRAGGLLHLWEQAGDLSPLERAVAMATVELDAAGSHAEESLRDLPLGRTHALLLDLHERLWGDDLVATAACPKCGERVEFTMPVATVRDVKLGQPDALLLHGGYVVSWRCPTPADLLVVATAVDPGARLADRCLSVTNDGRPVDPATLPDDARAAVDDLLADADPLAEIVVSITCPDCGDEFATDLDPGRFVWAELDAHAVRILHGVDVLARAYGWTEAEVLALGDRRRAAYLSLVLDGVP